MRKCNITVCADTDVIDLAQKKFPRQLSQLFNNFLKDLVMYYVEEDINTNETELQKELLRLSEQENKSRIQKQAIELRLAELNEAREREQSLLLTEEERGWIAETGVNIATISSAHQSYKTFQKVFLRSAYPFTEYEKVLRDYLKVNVTNSEGQICTQTT